ncbi:MAG: GGDEF domain-containing protein [Woeseiaceae bacterium]|nr:GGDEF domain-containing protein [Woeseiaceae bacterium]
MRSTGTCYALGILLAGGIALFDLYHPPGMASAMPYIALPLLGLLWRSTAAVFFLAALGTVLTLAGAVLSTPGAPLYVVSLNRGMSLILMWIVALTAVRHLAVGERLRKSLVNAANRDPLTRLFNRRHLIRVFRDELGRHTRYGDALSIILIDADHFKRLNDAHGHVAGDAALRAIAEACRQSARATDVVGRFGGEEFMIILPHSTALDATGVAERIRRTIRATDIVWQDQRLDVTLSLGVAEACTGADTFDGLLTAADQALYDAKRSGRNRVAVSSIPPQPPDKARAA